MCPTTTSTVSLPDKTAIDLASDVAIAAASTAKAQEVLTAVLDPSVCKSFVPLVALGTPPLSSFESFTGGGAGGTRETPAATATFTPADYVSVSVLTVRGDQQVLNVATVPGKFSQQKESIARVLPFVRDLNRPLSGCWPVS